MATKRNKVLIDKSDQVPQTILLVSGIHALLWSPGASVEFRNRAKLSLGVGEWVRRCVPKVLSVGVFGGKVSVAPPLLVAPPNRSPRQRLYTPSPVKELPKRTGGLRRLPPLDLGGRGPETTHEG
jgi:hypothetical protein